MGFKVAVKKQGARGKETVSLVVIDCVEMYNSADGIDMEGPGFISGLRKGDELQRFAGFVVTDLPAFNAVVQRHVTVGVSIPIVFSRAGVRYNAALVVGSRRT